MSITEIQLITTATVILWVDVLRINQSIINVLGYKSWIEKQDLPLILKWTRCNFCTSFWIGFIASIVYYQITQDIQTSLLFIASNLIVSKLYDRF